jgi:hypothetical protein
MIEMFPPPYNISSNIEDLKVRLQKIKDREKKIKEEIGATIRCIPFNQNVEPGVCIKTGNPSSQRVLFAKAY